ncbi:MAG: hypothetical protein LKH74_02425 [Levilactobacillus sp.]|jgi:ABC-type transport system involved in cytochrome bd biosynthesis fused ATPase/permease subunit|uniref:Uncharacterized protein n=1 Tax=Levilactobacillus suantsaiihabitans TaxID=2487722 RepID=A0A4Z0J8W6_9LACO|nr:MULTISPECIES: hypothetical protein [Levilactobacillus]MCH4123094.1 hypothetical protein [Levilactobacillus sp.]MCI1552768.1 hypothetical protein [Levilactobacillus sp.]MCI1599594.1 hypothetical protein [Levilactobacillus sp.]TGD18173.1 hypothetical protein EGT51_09685 [Levilactobacillus suantsaiihabitans]
MAVLTTVLAYKKIQFAIRMLIYVVVGVLVLVVRWRNKEKTRKRMDERTKKMMRETKKDKNGKYPWEQ